MAIREEKRVIIGRAWKRSSPHVRGVWFSGILDAGQAIKWLTHISKYAGDEVSFTILPNQGGKPPYFFRLVYTGTSDTGPTGERKK